MDDSIFVLDANVFIEAARRYYAFDLAPAFWESLIQNSETGRIRSIDRVKHELERMNDELAAWVKQGAFKGFASTDVKDIIESYSQIMIWVQTQGQFSDGAKADFANGADGWLVAYAKMNNCIVVTHEALNLEIKRKVPIPNVCQPFNVHFINTFEMLRRLNVRFVNQPA